MEIPCIPRGGSQIGVFFAVREQRTKKRAATMKKRRRVVERFKVLWFSHPSYVQAARVRIELTASVPETDVLPLHYRAKVAPIAAGGPGRREVEGHSPRSLGGSRTQPQTGSKPAMLPLHHKAKNGTRLGLCRTHGRKEQTSPHSIVYTRNRVCQAADQKFLFN